MANNLLIVEGESDKNFTQEFLYHEKLDISVDIQIATAPEIDSNIRHTSKQAVLHSLATVIKQLNDGRYDCIGILIDMDYQDSPNQNIKQQNIAQLSQALNKHDFTLTQQAIDEQGLFFVNPDFDNPIGVWLMPNNDDEGYLETWIEHCIKDTQASHFEKVENFIASFDDNHFKHNVISKAKVYTWLAIQPKPRQDFGYCLSPKSDLLDKDSQSYQNFKLWIMATFK